MIKYVLITLTILNTLPAIGAAFECATITAEYACNANSNCTWFAIYDSSNSKWTKICTNDTCAKNRDEDTCYQNDRCVWDGQYSRCTGCAPNEYHDGTACVPCDIPTGATITGTNANLTANKCKWEYYASNNEYYNTTYFQIQDCPPNQYSDSHDIKGTGRTNIQYSTDDKETWTSNPIKCETKTLTIEVNGSTIKATCTTPDTNPDISGILGEHAIKEPLMFEKDNKQYTWKQACELLNNEATIYPVLKKTLQLNISGTSSGPTIPIDCKDPVYNETITPPTGYTISETITFTKYNNKIATDTDTTGKSLSKLCDELNSGTTITPVYTENIYNICYFIGYEKECDEKTYTYTDIKTEKTKEQSVSDDKKNTLIKCTDNDNENCYECRISYKDGPMRYKGQIKIGAPLSEVFTDDDANTATEIIFFVTPMIECPENYYCEDENTRKPCPMGKRSQKNSTKVSDCTYNDYKTFCDNNGCYSIP